MLRWFRSLSLTAKVFVLLLPLAAVPPLAVMTHWYVVSLSEVEEEAKRSLRARWAVVERRMIGFFEQSNNRLQEVAESPLFHDLFGYSEYGLREEAANTKQKIGEYLLRVSERDKVYDRICFTYTDGHEAIRVVKGVLSKENGPAEKSLCPRAGAISASTVIRSTEKPDAEIPRKFVRLTMALLNKWKTAWAQITFDISLANLSNLLMTLPLPDEGAGLIIDGAGEVVACAQGLQRDQGGKPCEEAAASDEIKKLGFSKISTNPQTRLIQGNLVLWRRLPVSNLHWTVALLVTKDNYGVFEQRLAKSSVFSGVVFFVVALCALLPLSWRITAPLRRLEFIAKKIASGEFQQEVPVVGDDEIGRLGRSFNSMAVSLKNRDERLQKQASSLTARNEELTTLNRVLKRSSMSLTQDELLPALLDEILSVMALKSGAIRLVDGDSGVLRLAAQKGFASNYSVKPEVIRVGEGITGKVVATGEPIFIKDAQADPEAQKLLDRTPPEGGPLRCFAAVPIVTQEKVIGVLALGATGERTFRETDLSSLVSIGLGIGACIENAHLYKDLSEAYERLKTLQEQLIRAEKLSAMGQLVAGVAHEINNPLTTILGYAQLIHSDVNVQGSKDDIQTIIEQTKRCARVVEKLLTFARESEKHEEGLDLSEVVKDVIDVAMLSLSLHSIKLSFQFEKGKYFLVGDKYQLQQVILNILTNSQDALCEKDLPRLIEVKVFSQGGKCIIEVVDNGSGIPPELVQKVFDPFFTTKSVGKGTGLGLSLSYGIIKSHGGEISIESEVGVGTTVIITLPQLEARPQLANVEPPPSWRQLAGLHVLVVDDEKAICQYLHRILSLTGMEVVIARSLGEARKVIQQAPPDFILADVHLPDGEGLLLHEAIKSAAKEKPMHLFFMSGDIADDNTLKKLQDSAYPCIRKPFGNEEILQFISDGMANFAEGGKREVYPT